jgi:hypothetical protein
MIHLPAADTPLSSAERFALALLVDLSRLVPVDDPSANVVRLVVADTAPSAPARFAPGDGTVTLGRDLLRWVTSVAGAGAEQRSDARDRHGRVPSSENPLVIEGIARDPVVSRVAVELRDAVIAAAGERPFRLVAPWPHGHRWAAAFTHDLDVVSWWPLFTALRLAELARRGRGREILRSAGAALAAMGRSPVLAAAREVLEIERDLEIASTWFIICGTPTVRSFRAGDITYLPESPLARRILAELVDLGHELALHGSFATAESASAAREERERLERIAGAPVIGGRQHFLRMRPGKTQQAQVEAGFRYDATFGFPDRSGFRLGVADVVPAWDERAGEELPLELAPLTWMDRTLSKYQGVEDTAAWARDAVETAALARSVEGLWVGLWHPNLSPALGFPGAPAAYRSLAGEIVSAAPYVAPLRAIVNWRRARRAVRIARVLPGGGVEAYLPAGLDDQTIVLEDERGRPQEAVHPGR